MPLLLGVLASWRSLPEREARAAEQVQAAGAVEQLAQQVAAGLGSVPPTSVVVVAPLATDTPAPKGDELALRVAALLAGRLGPTVRAHPQLAQLGTARAVAGRTGGLVYLQVEISKGSLRATADVYPPQANAWDRVRNPLPAPTAHAFASARADAEVRAFLPPIVLEQASVHRAKHEEGEVLAAACGDADGDGGNELVLVSSARVVVAKVRAGKLAPIASAAWPLLAPRAPAPLREPIGTAAIVSGEAILVGDTDRGGVRLSPDLARHAGLAGLPLDLGEASACARPSPGASAFEGLLFDCAPDAQKRVLFAPPAARFDAFAAAVVTARDGASRVVSAARDPDGTLRVRVGPDDPRASARALGGVGAQVAVGDLDQDGTPEIVTTRPGGDDAVVIESWAGGEPVARRTLPAPPGVRALCICPPEERAAPALVALVGADEVWILR